MPLTYSFPYVGTSSFYSGTSSSSLVPDVFPVAIDGRPYMIDQKSGRFARGFEQRVRDSVDQSTAPGEAAINPGGLWRRGEVSWHFGAGQKYADTAESQDYRFYKSKGVNVWTKGQLSLLNDTSKFLTSSETNLMMVIADGRLYVADGANLKFTTDLVNWTTCDPPTTPWTDKIVTLTTDGNTVFLSYTTQTGVYQQSATSSSPHAITSYLANDNWYMLGYAKGFLFGAHSNTSGGHSSRSLHTITSGGKSEIAEPFNTGFTWIDVAAGQNAIYIAGKTGAKSYVYKLTIKTDGTLDTPSVSLELPAGETITSLHGYLGYILIGTNKGIRFCSTDNSNNLVAGSLIATTTDVKDFTTDEKYAWYGYTNYDGASSGLGRLDLSTFTSSNTPAYATDLMYGSVSSPATAAVNGCVSFGGKRVFSISGVGVIKEDTSNLVESGIIETGHYRWGIPDRKFIAGIDTRALPLDGTIETLLSLDAGDYESIGIWSVDGSVENSFAGTSDKTIEAQFKFVLSRESATAGPTMTRWLARAYAAPFRSEFFRVPILLHDTVMVNGKEYYYDVESELMTLRDLINNPRIFTFQIRYETISVILEDMEWAPIDAVDDDWAWQGTATVTMRSVQE